MGPIMLALSTFRQSDRAVELAVEKAKEGRLLVIVFVVDVNLARYLVGADLGLYPKLKEEYQEELLKEHQRLAEEKVNSIAKTADDLGISVRMYISTGRFALECLEAVEKEKPGLIITTRSRRPAWVKKLFGSPVDHLIANSGCPVVEA